MNHVEVNQSTSDRIVVEKNLVKPAEIIFYWNSSAQPFLAFKLTRENDGKVLLNQTKATMSKLGYIKVPLYDDGYRANSDALSFEYQWVDTFWGRLMHHWIVIFAAPHVSLYSFEKVDWCVIKTVLFNMPLYYIKYMLNNILG